MHNLPCNLAFFYSKSKLDSAFFMTVLKNCFYVVFVEDCYASRVVESGSAAECTFTRY